jgi:hypothetical protein
MRERRQILLPSVLALSLVALLLIPVVASASSGLPATVTMYPETAGPGEVVEVAGLDFPGRAPVEVQLTTAAGSVLVATATAAADGSFRELVTLPADRPDGLWELRASAAGDSLATYTFDPSAPAIGAGTDRSTTTAGSGNSTTDVLVLLVIAVVLGAIVIAGMFAWRQVRGDGAHTGMGTGDDLIWSGGSRDATPELTATDEPYWKAVKSET